MTTTNPSGKKTTYVRHSRKYKAEALKLTSKIGVTKAARQLDLHELQPYNWRKDSEHAKTVSEYEAVLAAENVCLKRQLAQQAEELSILKNAATYFAQPLKRGTTT